MKIANKIINQQSATYIIAEIGINHNGSVTLAKEMIFAASECGADAVKFQIIYADKSYALNSLSYPIFKAVEFSKDEWLEIVEYCRTLNIHVFATFVCPDDLYLADFFGFPAIKVSSTNVTNFPLLKAVAAMNKPVIMSSGMAYLSEVDEAYRYLLSNGLNPNDISILQCTALYPTHPSDINLNVIKSYQLAFPESVIGFSDHSEGIECALGSVVLGGRIIEKHFTTDKSLPGHDQYFSADPHELRALVQGVRVVEQAMGVPGKRPVGKENESRELYFRYVVAKHDLEMGVLLNDQNITVKRCMGKGIEPRDLCKVYGRKLNQSIKKDDVIHWEMI